MTTNESKLKPGQVPTVEVLNWKENLIEEKGKTFNLDISQIFMEKATFEKLAKNNENRIRVYLGLELIDKKYSVCAFAVSTYKADDGTGAYNDNIKPVFKLAPTNRDYSDKIEMVIESLTLWNSWRDGELLVDESALVRKYIYPKGCLLQKEGLDELFNVTGNDTIKIEFGIRKTFELMETGTKGAMKDGNGDDEQVFNDMGPCPPFCSQGGIYP